MQHVLIRLLRAGNEVEVVARCLLFLLEIHHGPIASSGNLEPVLAELDKTLRAKVRHDHASFCLLNHDLL